MGSETRGVYAWKLDDRNLLGTSECQSYFFRVVEANGQSWRFPERGRFLTTGINGCKFNYGG